MGVWGTKLFSSDVALDVRDHYRELIEDGVPDDEAARQTLGKYQSLFDDPEDGVVALLAFAITQSKIGRLDPEIRDRAVAAIDQGGDLHICEQEEPKLASKRKAELTSIRAQLTGPQPARKRLKPPKVIPCGLSAGDLLALELPKGPALVRVVRVQSYRKFELPILEELEYGGASLPSPEALQSLPRRTADRWDDDTWFNINEPGNDWVGAGFQRIGTIDQRAGDSHPRLPSRGLRSWEVLAKVIRKSRTEAESHRSHHEPTVSSAKVVAAETEKIEVQLAAKQVLLYLKEGRFIDCKLSDPTIQIIREMWPWNPAEIKGGAGPFEAMVWIPAGPFIYGVSDTARLAEIKTAFWIDQYPVTNQQYLAFLIKAGPTNIDKRWIGFSHKRCRITSNLRLAHPKYADHPVTEVSWYGAQAYAEAEPGRRLPTEEEWEKAARGMDGRAYPWGDEFDNQYANTEASGIYDTTPANEYAQGKSPYGAIDMAGNVWEWTNSEERAFKILRGGSWIDAPHKAHCAVRSRSVPELSDYRFGFRCART